MISVIIPIYNSENEIKQCIDSVLSQTYKDFELILVDDGSTDKSYEICQEYEKLDNRVRAYTQKNSGVSATRNKGISLAQGEFVQFIDSDDWIENNMMEKMVEAALKDNADLIICGSKEIGNDYVDYNTPLIEKTVKVSDLDSEYPKIFEKFILNPNWNKLYRKANIKENFNSSYSLGEDLMFNLAYIRNIDTITFIKDNLYDYNNVGVGLNKKKREDSVDIAEEIYIKCMEFAKNINMGKTAEIDISSTFLRFAFYGISDFYMFKDKSTDEKKKFIRQWGNNENIKKAVCVAQMSKSKEKIAQFLLKHNLIGLFHMMMLLKSRLMQL